jgi:hypothetical protein
MHGRVRMFRDRKLLFDVNNLVVIGATTAAAQLASGANSAAWGVSRVGYGSGSTTPGFNDTTLSGSAQYYNVITGSSFPSPGSVTFTFQLTSTDYAAALGINIQEIGLFGITNPVTVPAAINIVVVGWQANTAYPVGYLLVDSNGNIQRCTTAGTSNGSQHPTWNTVYGGTTTDNSVVWTMIAGGVAPVPMWAHALVPSFQFNGSANYTGSWTLTF